MCNVQTLSTILNFVLHMVQHPEVQVKAQEELDRVIGRSRLPDFEDRESLPYLDAIYKETLRLHPVARLGLPHRAIADDDYKGMRIPKGSIIFPNVWYVPCHSGLMISPPLQGYVPKREGVRARSSRI
jgi:cytochrome P450